MLPFISAPPFSLSAAYVISREIYMHLRAMSYSHPFSNVIVPTRCELLVDLAHGFHFVSNELKIF